MIINFSIKKLIIDSIILGVFIYANIFENSQLINAFLWFFWVMNILCLFSIFSKPSVYFSENRIKQGFYTELIGACVFAYFGYYFLATLGFFITLAFLGSRSVKQCKKENSNDD